MLIKINDINVCFNMEGYGYPIILLHGWGQNKETFKTLMNELKDNYRVYSIDLPGFGETNLDKPYTLDDYVDLLRKFINMNGISNPILLGHSFGGRIAIRYANKYPLKKLVLVSPAGINTFSIKKFFRTKKYRMMRFLKLKGNYGSTDYKNATGHLRKTLVNIVNEDLTLDLEKIKTDTLIIAGSKDKVIPLKSLRKMNGLIKNSKLAIIPRTKHFCYLEKYRYFYLVLNAFLLSDEK